MPVQDMSSRHMHTFSLIIDLLNSYWVSTHTYTVMLLIIETLLVKIKTILDKFNK